MLLHLFFAVSSFANIAVSCTFAVEIIVEFFGDVVNNHCVEPLPVGCINFTFCFTASDIRTLTHYRDIADYVIEHL